MERILVVTGARSEFGLLAPVIEELRATRGMKVSLAVTGVHLLRDYGHTIDEIGASGFAIDHIVPFYGDGPITDEGLPAALGRGVAGIAGALGEARAECVLVLGDRAEAMAGALAAYAGKRGVAHIHGGDKADSGHTDEGFRHAITRLAHLHFAASEESAKRLAATGEEEWRIRRVGAPGLDAIRRQVAELRAEAAGASARYGLEPGRPLALFVFHPDRLAAARAGAIARMQVDALLAAGYSLVAVHPNSDPGSEAIVAEIENAVRRSPARVASRMSLPRREFLIVMAGADVMIGNSSASLIEAPAFGLPVLCIGERNRNREHAANVLFVPAEPEALRAALGRVREDGEWRARCRVAPNPYGDGRSAERIARALRDTPADVRFFRKLLTR